MEEGKIEASCARYIYMKSPYSAQFGRNSLPLALKLDEIANFGESCKPIIYNR